MDAFCNPHRNLTAEDAEFAAQIKDMKRVFSFAQIIFCLIGVIGNILNLRTLQSPSLQTVPFMYIRALAVFDLISLSAIILHFIFERLRTSFILMFYQTYIEAALINTFLIAGLYLLLVHPHFKPSQNPKRLARKRIGFMLFCSTLLHLPMVLQTKLKSYPNGAYMPANNIDMLCREPHWTIFKYYKMGRECLRFCCVIIMTVLNVVIARRLQITKINRRRLVKRSCASDVALNLLQAPNGVPSRKPSNTSPEPNMGGTAQSPSSKREYTHLIKSFAEKKLTVLMISICIIFILGNVPQMLVMVLQNESMETVFGFQLYRNIANLLEVMNHCLNFYVFCMASKEYTRAFLLNCLCLRNILLRYPSIAEFINTRRVSSMFTTNSVSMHNRDLLSLESIQPDGPSINDEAREPCTLPPVSLSVSFCHANPKALLQSPVHLSPS
ncbi:hypothetical protein WR25_23322, partial [Diploscapter pachys]